MQKQKKKKQKREMFDSLWRAAALPGWGQFHNNQHLKGFAVGGAFIVSGGLTVYNVIDQKIKYDKYLNTNENHDIAFKEAENAYNAALLWSLVTAGVYIAGIVDAGINYENTEPGIFGIEYLGNGVMMCANLRW